MVTYLIWGDRAWKEEQNDVLHVVICLIVPEIVAFKDLIV